MGKCPVGLCHRFRRQLDAADLVVVYAGCGVVWTNRSGVASDKHCTARDQHRFNLSGFPAAHRVTLGKRGPRQSVWTTSLARRIRGLGGGTEGRFEHSVLVAGDLDVCPLRAKVGCRFPARVEQILFGPDFFCVGFDVQTHGGDPAVRDVAAGLLAIAAL